VDKAEAATASAATAVAGSDWAAVAGWDWAAVAGWDLAEAAGSDWAAVAGWDLADGAGSGSDWAAAAKAAVSEPEPHTCPRSSLPGMRTCTSTRSPLALAASGAATVRAEARAMQQRCPSQR